MRSHVEIQTYLIIPKKFEALSRCKLRPKWLELAAIRGVILRKLISTLIAVLLSLGFATPAEGNSTNLTAYQKTLATYSGNNTELSALQKSQIMETLDNTPLAQKFICTGIRYFDQPMSVNIMVRKRAKEACEYAKQLRPGLSTWFQNKPTKARSYAGKVLLTVKTTVETSVPIIGSPEVFPPKVDEQLPELLPPDQEGLHPAKQSAYERLIETYVQRVSQIQTDIDALSRIREIEVKKLQIASEYGDELREGIQEDTISQIDSRISSLQSNQAFYRSLIRTYESRIEASNSPVESAPEIPSGPSQAQIDSWNRLITLYESSISRAESQIARITKELRKLTYWRSVAVRYGDTARVEKLDVDISQNTQSINEYRSSIRGDRAEIALLRERMNT